MPPEAMELWDIITPEMPPRSRLFRLEPIGIGTAMQESLLGYIVRLAREHHVRPLTLIKSEILPLTEIRHLKSSSSFLTKYTKTINAHMKYAREFCRATQQLTQRDDLDNLTFLPWADVLDSKGAKVLHPHPKWCPACFQEWRTEHVEPYAPSAWSSAMTTICSQHRCKLVDACPWCGKHQPFIPKHQYLDHCSHCGSTLVGPVGHIESMMQADGIRSAYERYSSAAIGEMIMAANEAREYASYKNLQQRLRQTVQMVTDGNVTQFERWLGFTDTVIQQWISKNTRPQSGQLIKLCYRLGTSPVELLRDGPAPDLINFDQTFSQHRARPRRILTAKLRSKLEIELTNILENPNEHPTLKEVCKRLGHTINFLRYWFPDQCSVISNKHKDYVRERTISNKLRAQQITRTIVLGMLQSGKLISSRQIEAELRKHQLSSINPDIRAVVRKTKEDFLKDKDRPI
ncbi:hypothetical protein GALL_423630 [mine drainage metagenome]|uniref:TniQ domain-containing protein n=1 Tax=mine drainage metagenome TaxID=410659 RepID=A0A1J5PWU7_9ZZZZ